MKNSGKLNLLSMESIEEQVYLAVSNGDVEKSLQLIAMGLFFFWFHILVVFHPCSF